MARHSGAGEPQLQILVVPGNPGNAGFYQYFMRRLYAVFDGRVDVVAVSHLGHDTVDRGSQVGSRGRTPHTCPAAQQQADWLPLPLPQVWGLEDQIQHKVDFLRQHLLLPGRPPVVVLAHSIGAYIMLHALDKLEQHPPVDADAPGASASSSPPMVGEQSGAGAGGAAAASSSSRVAGSVTSNAAGGSGGGAHCSAASIPSVELLVSLFPFFSADFTNGRQCFLRAAAHCWAALGYVAAGVSRLPVRVQERVLRTFSRECAGCSVAGGWLPG
jgi:pimeloyl-ACP methyl ester carboxylesterase